MEDKEILWWAIMKTEYGLRRMDLVNCSEKIREIRLKRWQSLEDYLIRCLNNPIVKDIAKDVKTYDDFKKAEKLHNWLKDNTPEGYDFNKGMYDTGNYLSKLRGEMDYKVQKDNVDCAYIKKYIRSSGYETVEEAEKDFAKIAKKFGVNEYTIRKIVDRFFKVEEVSQKRYMLEKQKSKEKDR